MQKLKQKTCFFQANWSKTWSKWKNEVKWHEPKLNEAKFEAKKDAKRAVIPLTKKCQFQSSTAINSSPVILWRKETKTYAEEEVMVFKLFLSTLIGNLLLKEFFHFSSFRSSRCWFCSGSSMYVHACCVEDSRLLPPCVKQSGRRQQGVKEATENFFFSSVIPPSRTYSHPSPHWHRAIKHLWNFRTFFNSRSSLFCEFLIEHVAFSLASSQLCGAIDFNIIDFLCHYQPLAPLFLVLCTQKCVSVSEWKGT